MASGIKESDPVLLRNIGYTGPWLNEFSFANETVKGLEKLRKGRKLIASPYKDSPKKVFAKGEAYQILSNEERVRLLSSKIIESQENDRRYVAKELHDSVGCCLAAIKVALKQKLATMDNGARDDFCSLENILSCIQSTITEVRRIANHLMPSMLEDFGLTETIRSFCRDQSRYFPNARIITNLVVDEEDISDLLKITIFRVIQEAMKNAVHHGNADTIQVSLTEAGDGVELSVTDNGCGFDSEDIQSNSGLLGGFGLRGMNDRAVACNGTFKISSEVGRGTQVKLSLPFDKGIEDQS